MSHINPYKPILTPECCRKPIGFWWFLPPSLGFQCWKMSAKLTPKGQVNTCGILPGQATERDGWVFSHGEPSMSHGDTPNSHGKSHGKSQKSYGKWMIYGKSHMENPMKIWKILWKMDDANGMPKIHPNNNGSESTDWSELSVPSYRPQKRPRSCRCADDPVPSNVPPGNLHETTGAL